MSRLRQLVLLLVGTLVLAGCTAPSTAPDEADSGWPSPDPSRPVVDLSFEVGENLGSVQGREEISFTPDLRACELVFRAWPNKPGTARTGNALEVTGVWIDGEPAVPITHAAGAPDDHPGTLIEVPLPACVDAGTTISAELTFVLTLGEGTDERVGVAAAGDVAWFATAFPILAWERGNGWATDPAVNIVGEMTTSETFDLRSLEVTAPSQYTVMGTGAATGVQPGEAAGTTVHSFTDPAVRDVTVTVGNLSVLQRDVDGVRVHVGAPPGGTKSPLSRWADEIASAIQDVADHLGPFPYSDLWVSVLPDQTDGIEISGAIQFGDLALPRESWLITHEVAHMWLYGLVGNNQARHPWLDESFATAVQVIADGGDALQGRPADSDVAGHVGQPMEFWLDYRRPSTAYVSGVYTAGGAALLEARRLAGSERFDEALRTYLRENAHQIAEPADVEEAFGHLPIVLDTLAEAGALGVPEPARRTRRAHSRRRRDLELPTEVGDQPTHVRPRLRGRRRELVGHLLLDLKVDGFAVLEVHQGRDVVEGHDQQLRSGTVGGIDLDLHVGDLLAHHHRLVLADGPGLLNVVVTDCLYRVLGVLITSERGVHQRLPAHCRLRRKAVEDHLAGELVPADVASLGIQQRLGECLGGHELRELGKRVVDPVLSEHSCSLWVGLRRLDVDLGRDVRRVGHRPAAAQQH